MAGFHVSRLRLSRAKAHDDDLAQLWNSIPSEDLCSFSPRIDPSGTGQILAVGVKPIPSEFSLRLGEMLYQLRSALDACIYQATIYATKSDPPPKETSLEFPITNDPKEFPQLAKRRLWGLPQDLQDAIEHVQPYNTPQLPPELMVSNINRCLGILNDLSRKDRHRRLHVVGSLPLTFEPLFYLPEGVSVVDVQTKTDGLLEEQAEIATFRLIGFRSGMSIQVNPNMSTNIGCTEPPPACHVNDTLGQRIAEIINTVDAVIVAFENYKF